uniref:Zinc finger GRF-type domain-containing protein n=1 Tax=Lactuca sativa TaxID=4236 RepID=A0A9R1XV05_LACSA|nr:hypothetical protein LSAT_V11C100033880 [Lactuca sativa]
MVTSHLIDRHGCFFFFYLFQTNVEFQPENPCYCRLPSRVQTSRTKDNPGKKFRLYPNSMNEGPKCKFWEWLEPETPDNEVSSGKDKKEQCNLTLKICTLEN